VGKLHHPLIKIMQKIIDKIDQFNRHHSKSLDDKQLFWQEFDNTILQAIQAGEIEPLKKTQTRGGLNIAVKATDLFHYQGALLERIESETEIPFSYKKSFNALNREFYRRQGVLGKAVRVGNGVVFGVELEFKSENSI
jgi:hypothetical protein